LNYLCHILTLICIFSVLSISLNLVLGHGGVLTLAHAALFGIGAYSSAILTLRFQCPFLLGWVLSGVICAAIGAVIAYPSLRIRGDTFVVATFSLQVIVFSILNNWQEVTGGPMGIAGIQRPVVLGWRVDSADKFLALAILFVCFAQFLAGRLISSPFGLVLHTIREDEVVAEMAGKNTLQFKVSSFAISSALAGAAGGLYAHYANYIDPTSFTVMESIFIISIVVIGGAGSLWGPVVGTVALVSLPEALRFVGMPSSVAANVRQILYGAALVACMLWRPQGLIGEFSFRKNGNH
jgi:branched-chain amino acid transport system permease protein